MDLTQLPGQLAQNLENSVSQATDQATPLPAGPATLGTPLAPPPTPVETTGQGALSSPTAPTVPAGRGTFAQQMARAAQKIGIMPGPGGALKTIASAAVDALSGIETNLGDASTTPVTPGGSGILEGLTQTLANRSQRVQADKDRAAQQQQRQTENERQDAVAKASIAHENASTIHEQALVSQMGYERTKDMVSSQKGLFDTFTSGENAAPVIGKDLTENEAKTMLAQKKLDPTSQHIFATGVKEDGKDASGQPIYEPTYSVVGDIPVFTFDKSSADYVNRTHPGLPTPIKEGQQMAGYQAGQLLQQANTASAQAVARDKFLEENGNAEHAEATRGEKINLGPKWTQALAKYGIDRPDLAANSLMRDPEFLKQYPNFATDVIDLYGGREAWDQALDNVNKLAIERVKQAGDNVGKVGGIMTDEMKGQIAALPQDKQKILGQYNPDVQGTLYSLAYGPGDLDFDKIFPNRRYKGSQDLSAQQAINAIRQLNPNWSEQQYKQTSKLYTDITTGKMGNAIAQYNNVLQHGAEAQDVMESTWRQSNPKFLNSALNTLESQGWGTQVAKISSALQPVKEEYATLLANGYKPSQSEQTAYDQMFNPASTPAMVEAALKIVGAVGSIRLENINQQYKRVAGKNIPGILTQDAADAAKRLNLDNDAQARLGKLNIGDTIFHNENWKPATEGELSKQNQDQEDNKLQRQATASVQVPSNAKSQVVSGGKVIGYIDVNGAYKPLGAQ